jgi:hypothetical protein
MQDDKLLDSTRDELLERLRALDEPQASSSLAELAYRRAREALEKALEEARTIRLQAIDDARAAREREMAALVESLKGLRQAAEAQIESLLREAELQAEALRDQAQSDARTILEAANRESATVRAEAAALRAGAEERAREVARLEADFDAQLEAIGKRLGMQKPKKGLFGR